MSLNEKDFIVLGKNPVTEMVMDGNVITLFNILGYKSGYVSFVINDNFRTSRGITYPANEKRIKNLYGETEEKVVNYLSDKLYLSGLNQNIDVIGITKANKCLEYTFDNYSLRFYFDKGGQMTFLAYCKNYDNIPIK